MKYQIITFYEFKKLANLDETKVLLKAMMSEYSIYGTFIIAEEGFNSTVCGETHNIKLFVHQAEKIFDTKLVCKSSFHEEITFRRQKVKIKKEIVTLRKSVNIELGIGTHVAHDKWNELLSDPDVVVLDARNDYEHKVGTFEGAVNPGTDSFNELPDFVKANLDPGKHQKIAMFCTGGIRCEKFAPYMKSQGFEEVYQLEGGILRYLEESPEEQSLWRGECFVFDERISVDDSLNKGSAEDYSVVKKELRK